jgi:hypothetical protein
MHPASITKSVPEKNFRALVVDRAISRWGYASPDGRVAAKSVVDNALAKSWSDYAGALLDAGHFKESRLASQKALFHNWRHTSGLKVWIKSLLWPLYQPKN